jgi:hypothetical protein
MADLDWRNSVVGIDCAGWASALSRLEMNHRKFKTAHYLIFRQLAVLESKFEISADRAP